VQNLEDDIVVVRQRPLVFIVVIVVGVLFFVFPWLAQRVAGSSLWVRLLFSGLGLAALAVGISGWRHLRIGLVIDQHGVWCTGFRFRGYTVIAWDDIEDVRLVWWSDLEGHYEAVLLDVSQESYPYESKQQRTDYRLELESAIGSIDFFNPLLLHHEEWKWAPAEVVELVQQCTTEPQQRKKLGTFKQPTPDRRKK
jgi:hypothetical protein